MAQANLILIVMCCIVHNVQHVLITIWHHSNSMLYLITLFNVYIKAENPQILKYFPTYYEKRHKKWKLNTFSLYNNEHRCTMIKTVLEHNCRRNFRLLYDVLLQSINIV